MRHSDASTVILLVHVNYIILTRSDSKVITITKLSLQSYFTLRELKKPKYLGIEITFNEKNISLHKEVYIRST